MKIVLPALLLGYLATGSVWAATSTTWEMNT